MIREGKTGLASREGLGRESRPSVLGWQRLCPSFPAPLLMLPWDSGATLFSLV